MFPYRILTEDEHSDKESNDEHKYECDDADDEDLVLLVVADELLAPLDLVRCELPQDVCPLVLLLHIRHLELMTAISASL